MKSSKTAPTETIPTENDPSTVATSTSETTAESTSEEPVIAGSYNFIPNDGQFDPHNTNLEEAQESNPQVDTSDGSTPDVTEANEVIGMDYVEESKRFCLKGRLIFPLMSKFKYFLFIQIIIL